MAWRARAQTTKQTVSSMSTFSNVLVRPWWFVDGGASLVGTGIYILDSIIGVGPMTLGSGDAVLIDTDFVFTSNDSADNTAAFGLSVNTLTTIQFPAIANVPKQSTFSATSTMSYACKRRLTGLSASDTVYFLCSLTVPATSTPPGVSVSGFVWL
jgi:hypothetical protein